MPSDLPSVRDNGAAPHVNGTTPDAPMSSGISREEIGRRLRSVRMQRNQTLRQLASAAGLSATHISEIERGRTMPTIGVLLRLARALGTGPGTFLEAAWRPDMSLVRAGDPKATVPRGALAGGAERLTHGIPGGSLICVRLTLTEQPSPFTCGPEIGGYVLRGTARIRTAGNELVAEVGDGFHLAASTPVSLSSATEDGAEVLILLAEPPAG